MKKNLIIRLALVSISITFILSDQLAFAQCPTIYNVNYEYLVNGQPVTTVCTSANVSLRITNLTDGAKYTLAYGSYSNSQFYESDGRNSNGIITWNLGTVNSSLSYTVTALLSGCSVVSLNKTITVGSPTIGLTLTSTHPDPYNVCGSEPIRLNLSVTGNVTYKWYSRTPNGNPIDDLHYPNSGTSYGPTDGAEYWVQGTGACNTTATSDRINVRFLQPASSASIYNSSQQTRCIGSGTSTVTATASGATSYKWSMSSAGTSSISPSNPVAWDPASGPATGTITWDQNFSSATPVSVTVTFYGCGGSSSSATNSTAVLVTPQRIQTVSGGAITCSGVAGPITIAAAPGEHLEDMRYTLWRNGNIEVTNKIVQSEWTSWTWNFPETGVYTVTGNSPGCYKIVGSATIGRLQPGSISMTYTPTNKDPNQSCQGDIITLNATGADQDGYTWSADRVLQETPSINNGTAHGPQFKPIETAVYKVSGKESICHTPSFATQGVFLGAIPTAEVSPYGTLKIKHDEKKIITGPQPVAGTDYRYQWLRDGSDILGETNRTINADKSGVYKLRVTMDRCPSLSTSSLQLTINKLAVVDITGAHDLVLPSNSLDLTGIVSDPDGIIQSSSWSMGDVNGKFSTTSALFTTLSKLGAGPHSISLTVVDDFNETTVKTIPVTVNYPSNNYNYVRETVVKISGQTEGTLDGLTVDQKNVQTTYLDGLGRPMQLVNHKASPGAKADVVQPVIYDAYGKESVKYLPYVSTQNDGTYKEKPTVFTPQNGAPAYEGSTHYNYYNSGNAVKIKGDTKPYAVTMYEPSPLNRVLKQGAPGSAWQPIGTDPYSRDESDRTIKKSYETNTSSDNILRISYDAVTESLSVSASAVYSPNSLFANKTYDEKNNLIIEFVDKDGRTICKKVQAGETEFAITYYIYDDHGNLLVVIPPQAVAEILNGL